MLRNVLLLSILVVIYLLDETSAAEIDEARKLKDEAIKVLQAGSTANNIEQVKKSVEQLERALKILEDSGQTTSALANEINSALYWGRKLTVMPMDTKESRIERAASGESPYVNERIAAEEAARAAKRGATQVPPPVVQKTNAQPVMPTSKEIYLKAQEKTQGMKTFEASLFWFDTSEKLVGSEYRERALANASLGAQSWFRDHRYYLEPLPQSETYAVAVEGDALWHEKKFGEALGKYREAIALKKNCPILHRRAGYAGYEYASQLRQKLMPQFQAAEKQFQEAKKRATQGRRGINYSDPGFIAAQQRAAQLNNEAQDAIKIYEQATSDFRMVESLSPNRQDIDAAVYHALCYAARGNMSAQLRARSIYLEIVSNYKVISDREKMLFLYAKSESYRLAQ